MGFSSSSSDKPSSATTLLRDLSRLAAAKDYRRAGEGSGPGSVKVVGWPDCPRVARLDVPSELLGGFRKSC